MSEEMMAGMIIGGGLGAIIVVLCIIYILEVIGSWKIMNKFGEPGWKTLIPFYRVFVEYKYTWNPHMMWLASLAPVIGQVMQGREGEIIATIGSILVIVGTIFYIIGQHKLSKAFGHGVGFTLGLIFLPMLFTIILGFGKSKYIRKQ